MMLRNLQNLSGFERRVIFFFVFGGILLALIAVTVFLALQALNSERRQAVPLIDNVTVTQFAVLPDDDAYPASLAAITRDVYEGVYTGSYVTGSIWLIDSEGVVIEVPGTRDAIGSVAGLTVAPDGTLYIVDRQDSNPRVSGGFIRQVLSDGSVEDFVQLSDADGFIAPDDITFDSQGRVYVSDRGRREVWRFESDGSGGVAWWTSPGDIDNSEPTGLEYDLQHDAILITDPGTNTIYRVNLASNETEILYQHGEQQPDPPGFDGITITSDGEIYVAALGLNRIAHLNDGKLEYIAGLFRGSSDVAFSAGKLYIANFDQFSLLVGAVRPQLPFALDIITLP